MHCMTHYCVKVRVFVAEIINLLFVDHSLFHDFPMCGCLLAYQSHFDF